MTARMSALEARQQRAMRLAMIALRVAQGALAEVAKILGNAIAGS